MNKYVLLGSAPHMKDYWPKVRDYYIGNGYQVISINNAWSLERSNLETLYLPCDFLDGSGTLIPSDDEIKNINIVMMPKEIPTDWVWYEYCGRGRGSTMSINVMLILLNKHIKEGSELELVVVGSDYIYKKGEDTHFYGKSKPLKNVTNQLKINNPEYLGMAADPLRFGNDWLVSELNNVLNQYIKYNYKIFVDTPYPKDTLLPFDLVNKIL